MPLQPLRPRSPARCNGPEQGEALGGRSPSHVWRDPPANGTHAGGYEKDEKISVVISLSESTKNVDVSSSLLKSYQKWLTGSSLLKN